MKKYLFICLALMSAALIWAEEAALEEPRLDIDGNATVSWGIDLGKGTGNADDRYQTHGFKNEMSWKVKFPILKKETKTSGRKEDAKVYGELTLKDIQLAVESKHDAKDFKPTGKVDSLEAKFVFFGAYLQVYNAPSFKTNYADLWKPVLNDGFNAHWTKDGKKFDPGFDAFGTKIGYKNANLMDLDIGLKVGSNNHWAPTEQKWSGKRDLGKFKSVINFIQNVSPDPLKAVPQGEIWVNLANGSISTPGDTPSTARYAVYEAEQKDYGAANHSKYGLGFDFSMKPLKEKLEFAVTFNTLFDSANDYKKGIDTYTYRGNQVHMNTGAELKSEPMKDLKLKFGFDGGWAYASYGYDPAISKPEKRHYVNGSLFAWDMLFETSYKWVSGALYAASEGTPFEGYNSKTNLWTADLGARVEFKTEGKKDKANYLLEGLDAGVYLGMYRFIATANKKEDSKFTLPLIMKVWASYEIKIGDSMSIKPFATFWGETNHVWHTEYRNSNSENKNWEGWVVEPYFGIAYNVGVTYMPVEKVEITARWDHGKMGKNKYPGRATGYLIDATANHNNHNGTFVLSCKVKY